MSKLWLTRTPVDFPNLHRGHQITPVMTNIVGGRQLRWRHELSIVADSSSLASTLMAFSASVLKFSSGHSNGTTRPRRFSGSFSQCTVTSERFLLRSVMQIDDFQRRYDCCHMWVNNEIRSWLGIRTAPAAIQGRHYRNRFAADRNAASAASYPRLTAFRSGVSGFVLSGAVARSPRD
jgi:hypothetical protein